MGIIAVEWFAVGLPEEDLRGRMSCIARGHSVWDTKYLGRQICRLRSFLVWLPSPWCSTVTFPRTGTTDKMDHHNWCADPMGWNCLETGHLTWPCPVWCTHHVVMTCDGTWWGSKSGSYAALSEESTFAIIPALGAPGRWIRSCSTWQLCTAAFNLLSPALLKSAPPDGVTWWGRLVSNECLFK